MNEWETEPDREEFVHAELPCLILRTPLKQLCGYVGVPPSHPMYQKDYDDIDVVVHGGLTFSHMGGFDDRWREGFWWVGFDCAHFGDYVPGIDEALGTSRSRQETYRNWAWVKAKTQRLAEQLAAMMVMPDYNEWIESVRKGGEN